MIDHIDYHILDYCNLNCARCNNFGPLASKDRVSYENFCKEWQYVHDKGFEFKEIRILGGETFLHPELDKMLIFLRSLYPNPSIVVYSNGIPIMGLKDKYAPIFKEYNLILFISQYPNTNINLDEIKRNFPRVNTSNVSGFMNTSLHTTPDFNQDHSFQNCNVGSNWKCRALRDYHMYPCSFVPTVPNLINYFSELQNTPIGQIDIKKSGIDIRTHSVREVENFIQHSIPFCRFCNSVRAREFKPWHLTEYKLSEWVENGSVSNSSST